ncbi:MAG: DNA translocase FtsK 4TM domain-containing protein [Pseudomonadota bacterium]
MPRSSSTASPSILPRALQGRLRTWVRQGVGCAMVVVAIAGCVSLLTWSVNDPSLSQARGGQIANLLGPLGAIASDLLLQIFGLISVFALLTPALWGGQLLCDDALPRWRLKLLFYPLSILALAGAVAALPTPASWPLHHGFGGILGDLVLRLISSVFSVVNPDRAAIAGGVALSVGGTGAAMVSLGVTKADVALVLWGDAAASGDAGDMLGANAGDGAAPVAAAVAATGGGAGASAAAVPYPDEIDPQGHHDDAIVAPGGSAKARPSLGIGLRRDTLGETVPADDNDAAWGAPARDAKPNAKAPPSQRNLALARDLAEVDVPDARFVDDDDSALDDPMFAADHPDDEGLSIAQRFAPRRDDDDGYGEAWPQAQVRQPAHDDEADDRPATRQKLRRGLFRRRDAKAAQPQAPMPAGDEAADAETAHTDAAHAAAASRSQTTGVRGLLDNLSGRDAGPRPRRYRKPPLTLLKRGNAARPGPEFTQTVLRGSARLLEDVLRDFGVNGDVKDVKPGPVVTLFELEPARGTKSSRVINLADDIARSMSATSVRVAVVPGRNVIGIELPNVRRETVFLRDLFEAPAFRNADATLPVALGKTIGGEPVVADLARMPHLLVAGTTGSGKSVGVNAMILSLLFKKTPDECRFHTIDPNMLELSVYNGIPHLLTPVVTDPHKAVHALNWAVREMEERYKRMATLSVRNIDVFNNRVRHARQRGETLGRTVQTGFDEATGKARFERDEVDLEPMPHIVVVVDEFADLMVVAGKEIEGAVQRLAQMARAAGIHLIMATQRPSVDIITGTIKANFPTRISFKVASKIDSRTILNEQGAEQLLGQGDMLYTAGGGQVTRVHGAFVADEEVEEIAAALRNTGEPAYIEGVTDEPEAAAQAPRENRAEGEDLYDRAVAVVLRDQKVSTSYVQRRLSIGYNRAADLIERMEADGVISAPNAAGKRRILLGESGDAT